VIAKRHVQNTIGTEQYDYKQSIKTCHMQQAHAICSKPMTGAFAVEADLQQIFKNPTCGIKYCDSSLL